MSPVKERSMMTIPPCGFLSHAFMAGEDFMNPVHVREAMFASARRIVNALAGSGQTGALDAMSGTTARLSGVTRAGHPGNGWFLSGLRGASVPPTLKHAMEGREAKS